ncbi:hypothetical protein BFP72_12320 [Reichenbachiella sp. 5M10]|nr:hypothetical protein BFP72_12320 [Reichenbachiella sp. 5M10]
MVHSLSCCDKSNKETASKPLRKTQYAKVISPENNSTFALGDEIEFLIRPQQEGIEIDSITAQRESKNIFSFESNHTGVWKTKNQTVGSHAIILTIYLNNQTIERRIVNLKLLAKSAPQSLTYQLINSYPHDPTSYTQGLIMENGVLYESTGQQNESSVNHIDIQSGQQIKQFDLEPKYFGEGIAIKGDSLYMLTYRAQKGFIFDKNTLSPIDEFYYHNAEGWGLTTINDDTLVMSDGSHKLFFKDPNGFTDLRIVEVYDNHGPIDFLNELEYVNGKIFANRYLTDKIYMINPTNGQVEGVLDLSGILDLQNYHERIDVLNGIAYNKLTKTYYITGKWWPKLFEIEILNQEQVPI